MIQGTFHAAFPMGDPSRVGEARRHAAALAFQCGLGEVEAGRLALVVTELGTNLLRHAGILRGEPLSKPPGVAEAVDWAEAATALARTGASWPEAFRRSLGAAIKDEEDLAHLRPRLAQFIPGMAA